jgi:hypothetical protein
MLLFKLSSSVLNILGILWEKTGTGVNQSINIYFKLYNPTLFSLIGLICYTYVEFEVYTEDHSIWFNDETYLPVKSIRVGSVTSVKYQKYKYMQVRRLII